MKKMSQMLVGPFPFDELFVHFGEFNWRNREQLKLKLINEWHTHYETEIP